MMTFYCPSCWAEVPESARICRRCGDDIAERLSQLDYADQLIAALHHPEPMTALRVAWILGERREQRAAPALAQLVRETRDPYLIEAAIRGLGKIGGDEALETLRWALSHPFRRVRAAAQRVLP